MEISNGNNHEGEQEKQGDNVFLVFVLRGPLPIIQRLPPEALHRTLVEIAGHIEQSALKERAGADYDQCLAEFNAAITRPQDDKLSAEDIARRILIRTDNLTIFQLAIVWLSRVYASSTLQEVIERRR